MGSSSSEKRWYCRGGVSWVTYLLFEQSNMENWMHFGFHGQCKAIYDGSYLRLHLEWAKIFIREFPMSSARDTGLSVWLQFQVDPVTHLKLHFSPCRIGILLHAIIQLV
jgi:hypothetical protein